MEVPFLTTRQLAQRWNMASKTLSNWRCIGRGPQYHRMGTRINYHLEDVEDFELNKLCRNTSEYPLKVSENITTLQKQTTEEKDSLEQIPALSEAQPTSVISSSLSTHTNNPSHFDTQNLDIDESKEKANL